MHTGYIKLHRCITRHPVFEDGALFRLWIFILCQAAYTPQYKVVKNQTVSLFPGQCLFGAKLWSELLGLPPSTLRRKLLLLSGPELCLIRIQPQKTHSVITVLNWEKYQYTAERHKAAPNGGLGAIAETQAEPQRTQLKKEKIDTSLYNGARTIEARRQKLKGARNGAL